MSGIGYFILGVNFIWLGVRWFMFVYFFRLRVLYVSFVFIGVCWFVDY